MVKAPDLVSAKRGFESLSKNTASNAELACHASSYASCSIGDLERSCERGLALLP